MPGVRIHNSTDESWKNVSMAINKRFYFYCPDGVPGNGGLSCAAVVFQNLWQPAVRPTIVPMKMLTVYAQLPSGKRAIRDVKYEVKTEPVTAGPK